MVRRRLRSGENAFGSRNEIHRDTCFVHSNITMLKDAYTLMTSEKCRWCIAQRNQLFGWFWQRSLRRSISALTNPFGPLTVEVRIVGKTLSGWTGSYVNCLRMVVWWRLKPRVTALVLVPSWINALACCRCPDVNLGISLRLLVTIYILCSMSAS